MGTVTTLPRGRPMTVDDLVETPDDGHRYELVDGTLVVTPSPSRRHQRMSFRLGVVLDASCPGDLEVLAAPFDVLLADDTVLQPDLLVARRPDITEPDLPASPLLVVEVLSASTRLVDLALKRSRYEAAGCPSYWVVDPDVPSLIAWELHESRYVEVARVEGDQVYAARMPYAVTVTPARLLD